MKKQLFIGLILAAATLLPSALRAQSTVDAGQSTEGDDFWVTFLQADQENNNGRILSLSFSSRENCTVTIEQPYSGFKKVVNVTAGVMHTDTLYIGQASPKDRTNNETVICYSFNSEQVDTSAVHVTVADGKKIALFAANYKKATFDATNVLPTASLLSEYVIQTATPADHEGDSKSQGSHFAIIAVEDNTVVEYIPSVTTTKHSAGQLVKTDTLEKGQVWYVWTGMGAGHSKDLSGTIVRALNNKKIAVFQGNPHTGLPYYGDYNLSYGDIRERDHIVSQAMPTQYWGNTFAITASKNRKLDVLRIMALNDSTVVRINGDSVYTFDFATNPKQYYEFQIGEDGVVAGEDKKEKTRPTPLVVDSSCFIETSCPCAVHLFIASRGWDGKRKENNGDPSMVWINPIEQQISEITFTTFDSKNTDKVNPSHYVNIVTTADNVDYITLDGVSKKDEFHDVSGSKGLYKFARLYLGQTEKSYTLKGDPNKGFIAHVYGFTANESYGYSAGGATKPLTQYITINGQVFSPDTKNTLCGEDTVKFACHPDYEFEKIKWNFGDGVVQEFTYAQATGSDSVVPHYYASSGTYDAYVLIYRESSHVCVGQNAVDSIPITVTIGRYIFAIKDIDVPCPEDGKAYIGKVFYTNDGNVDLHGDNVKIEFDATAKADGFKDSELVINDAYFQITIPSTAKPETAYGIHLVITSDCGGTDTTMHFMLNYDKDVITQRYDNVLGLLKDAFKKPLSDFQWYRTSDSTAIEGQTSSVLNFNDLPKSDFSGDTYYVCFTVNKGQSDETKTCACAKGFKAPEKYSFDQNPDSLHITATYAPKLSGGKVFVNADWKGKTDIECYAQWITASGKVYQGLKFNIPDGGCLIEAPKEKGLYMLRVTTDGKSRSFKMIINE